MAWLPALISFWMLSSAKGSIILFMVPGGLIDPFLPALARHPDLKPIVAAHEGAAAYMADGYARASGRFGAAIGIGGPGLCNMTTAVAAAKTDSSPVLILSGEVPVDMEGLGEFQDASQASLDDTSVMRPLTRLSTTVASSRNLNHWLRHGLTAMLSQPSGPVHLSMTHDTLVADCAAEYVPVSDFFTRVEPLSQQAAVQALDLLAGTKRIAILAGAGVEHDLAAGVEGPSPSAGPSRSRRRCARRAFFRKITNSRSACSAMPAPGMRPRRCSTPSLSSCSSSAPASTSATPCTGRCARDQSRGGFTSIPTCRR